MATMNKPVTGDADWASEVNSNWTDIETKIVEKSIFTAKGELLAASGASTPAVLSVGSDGQALIADSTQAKGVKWGTNTSGNGVTQANVEATTQSVGNTTTETTIFSKIVTANSMGSDGLLRLLMTMGADRQGNGSLTLRFKFGGATFFSIVMSSGDTDGTYNIECLIANTATNVQREVLRGRRITDTSDISSWNTPTPLMASNGGSIDTTSDQTLAVTAQWSSNPTLNPSVEMWYASLELVK